MWKLNPLAELCEPEEDDGVGEETEIYNNTNS